jgi:hypothetical protein
MTVLPPYDPKIRLQSATIRLMALSDLYNIYIPSSMSVEIYSKLYLALLRSLHKKEGISAQIQRNENHKRIFQRESNSILGGADSFSIIGVSGIGKSTAINRAIELISEKGILENPHTKIIPCLVAQCPHDSSVKGLLLEILRKVDVFLDSDYYQKALRNRVTTDMLIGNVAQIALNHIGLLVVDEIQNVVNNKNGKALVAMLTQLINSSGISICMVGTQECALFFEQAMQLARRALGLYYSAVKYDQFFCDFCATLFQYQYVKNQTELSDSIVRWLYDHSGGIISIVVSLIHDAQELAILNGTETLNLDILNEAYTKRLTMLHRYISLPSKPIPRKKKSEPPVPTVEVEEKAVLNEKISDIVSMAKEQNSDIVSLLQKKFIVEVITI